MTHRFATRLVCASVVCASAFVASSTVLSAQPNTMPGLDGATSNVSGLTMLGRRGTFPNGNNGLSFTTTSCNPGTVLITFRAAMDPNHPFIAFMMTRELDGRFVQISDRSFLKHAFVSTNSPGCGLPCRQPPGGGSQLGLGCSDTYGAGLNGDRFWLGPAREVDPWLGEWDPVGSHFDRGEPPVSPPQDSDGIRSPILINNPVRHRMRVSDSELDQPGARFFYQGYYVFEHEAEANRRNNARSQEVRAAWNGSSWGFPAVGGQVEGPVLERWAGATVTSNSNGNDDGRFYVGLRVTGPTNGLYHYEYAIQNRDNSRGAASLRIPICPNARVLNAGFRDIDDVPSNQWTVSKTATELSFLAAVGNELSWNTIYNFWFDSDAAPSAGQVHIDQANPGPGALFVNVPAEVPGFVPNEYLGDGCGVPAAPDLFANGQATIGNAGFALVMTGAEAGASTAINVSVVPANIPIGGCTSFMNPGTTWVYGSFTADGNGVTTAPTPVPVNPSLEGASVTFQGVELQNGGALFGALDLSNGLRVRIGDNISGCQ